MKKGIAKYTAFVLAAGLVLTESGMTALAAPDTALVGIASTTVKKDVTNQEPQTIEGTVVTDEAAETVGETDIAAQQIIGEDSAAETAAEEAAAIEAAAAEEAAAVETAPVVEETEAVPLDTSMVGTRGFAQCSEYLNVRSGASADTEAVGKIYNNGSLQILDVTADGWYLVQSGNVSGYVSADYVAIGDAAEQIATDTGYTTAEVGADALNVRSSATTDSDVIAMIAPGEHEIEVVEDQGDWVKVLLDGEMYGYLSADYISTTTEYATGETLEEEQARLDREWLAYLAEEEAKQAAAEAAYLAAISAQTSYYEPAVTYSAPSVSGNLQADCNDAYQRYLDAQQAADNAVANGEGEQQIIDTAAAAQSAYADYLTLQNQVDAQAAGMTTSSGSGSSQSASYSAPASTGDLQTDCNNAYQEYLDAQQAADDAVANGDGEQAIVDTAAAAQSAYADYLALQNQVDAQAAGATVTEEAAPAAQTATYEEPAAEQTTYEEPASPAPAESSSASSTGQAIANYACQFVGNPYVYGGSSLTGGADCSGFTMSVLANFGIGLPHNAAAQSGCGTPVSMDSLQPGDLLFYDGGGGIGHVSIYIGGGQVVHASNPTNGIIISSIGYRTPVAARRFV